MFTNPLSREPFVNKIYVDDSHAVFEIDTKKAGYKGRKFKDMNRQEKRRFENVLFLDNPKIQKQFRYL